MLLRGLDDGQAFPNAAPRRHPLWRNGKRYPRRWIETWDDVERTSRPDLRGWRGALKLLTGEAAFTRLEAEAARQ